MLYTKKQKNLEKCFYVVRGGKIATPKARDYNTHPENESPLWEGKELTPQERENRLTLLENFYATSVEDTPFQNGELTLVHSGDNAGPRKAPVPRKSYFRETMSVVPQCGGQED
jgi:hypothetical protein